MKKEKIPLQEFKSHKKNIKTIFSQSEQSLFMGIVFESQTEKRQILALYVYYALFPQEKYTDYSERTYGLRQPQSGI